MKPGSLPARLALKLRTAVEDPSVHARSLQSWTAACQAPLPMGFSRQEYWVRLPCPLPGDLPNPGIEPRSPALQVDSLPSEPAGKPENTGVDVLSLLYWNFPTPEWNLSLSCLLDWQAGSLPPRPLGSPLWFASVLHHPITLPQGKERPQEGCPALWQPAGPWFYQPLYLSIPVTRPDWHKDSEVRLYLVFISQQK